MSDPLSAQDLARMRAEHVVCERCPGASHCRVCFDDDQAPKKPWPCDAALLLAEMERRTLRPGLTSEEAQAAAMKGYQMAQEQYDFETSTRLPICQSIHPLTGSRVDEVQCDRWLGHPDDHQCAMIVSGKPKWYRWSAGWPT